MASRRRLALVDELRQIVRDEIRAALAPADHSGQRSPAAWDDRGSDASERTDPTSTPAGTVKREKLGHRLKRVRIARDLSLRETANKVGVSPTYLSRVENCLDPSPPTEKTLRALADVLADNLDELMQLAGRVPEDVEKLIKADPDMPVMLRRAREQNVTGAEFLEWLETKKKGGK